ncbi:hypothetical protein V5F38_12390 [Xanthobacter sp. V0B-10]|uniref:hypothetical protein n=1 Tax=Xanthobacter albus TaxID=3119929 RepID=UPI00372A9AE4
MTTAFFAIVTVVALLWMMRVEARLREIFDRLDRLDRQEQAEESAAEALQERLKIF